MLLLAGLHHVHIVLAGANLVAILLHALQKQLGVLLAAGGDVRCRGRGGGRGGTLDGSRLAARERPGEQTPHGAAYGHASCRRHDLA